MIGNFPNTIYFRWSGQKSNLAIPDIDLQFYSLKHSQWWVECNKRQQLEAARRRGCTVPILFTTEDKVSQEPITDRLKLELVSAVNHSMQVKNTMKVIICCIQGNMNASHDWF